ncbi:transcription factor MYB30-like [Asparagus officinalis]|uniref:transcription factor MYB30-like n=1 Tax=Asparagus officinalis TaxID=4686 RepID=UPI00098E741C|nr:transcription factor MYB30-like [Asparagus officinalis]
MTDDIADDSAAILSDALSVTHLKKKLKKLENGNGNSTIPKGQWERRLQTDILMAKQALCDALSVERKPEALTKPVHVKNSAEASSSSATSTTTTTYASSTENISRLLENWMKASPSAKINNGAKSAKHFLIDDAHPVHIYWDLKNAKFSDNPEPLSATSSYIYLLSC